MKNSLKDSNVDFSPEGRSGITWRYAQNTLFQNARKSRSALSFSGDAGGGTENKFFQNIRISSFVCSCSGDGGEMENKFVQNSRISLIVSSCSVRGVVLAGLAGARGVP